MSVSVDKGVLPKQAVVLAVEAVDTLDKTSVGKVNKVALRQSTSRER
jgi:fatty-acyl-CoA synthase